MRGDPRSSARALPCILFDHIQIFFDTEETLIYSSIFIFENMWLSHDQLNNDVRQFWCSLTITNVDLGGRLVLKLRS